MAREVRNTSAVALVVVTTVGELFLEVDTQLSPS